MQGRPNPGCPSGCVGYELTADLDFDEDGDGTRNDTYNTGSGWQPIGDSSQSEFNAVFEGNGHAIANLFINRGATDGVGLFGLHEFHRGHPQPGADRRQRLWRTVRWRAGGAERGHGHRQLRNGQRFRWP